MPSHTEQRKYPYSLKQVYDLVADVESYGDFLPWCSLCRINSRKDNVLIVDMLVNFKILQEKFTSKVTLTPPKDGNASVTTELVEGPFTHLTNKWELKEVQDGTIVDFSVDFRFRSAILEKMIGLMFDQATRKMADAFEKRAEILYGSH